MPAAVVGAIAAAAPAIGAIGTAASAGMAIANAVSGPDGGGQSGIVGGGVNQANGISQAAINQSKAIYQPYIDQGGFSTQQQGDLLGLNGQDAANVAMSTFQASPGYQYQLQQGLKAVDQGAAARGMARSGDTLMAEQTLGNNLANQDFTGYMQRLNALSQIGLSGTTAYTNILSGQSTNQQSTVTSGAGQQASIYGNDQKNALGALTGLGNTAKGLGSLGNINGTPSTDPNMVGSSGYQTGFLGTGIGGGNSTGANELQSMGFYNPLPTY